MKAEKEVNRGKRWKNVAEPALSAALILFYQVFLAILFPFLLCLRAETF